MTHVAYWQVIGRDMIGDAPIRAFIEGAAIGELRLAASRNDAELDGEPTRTEVHLYRVEVEEEGEMRARLEPAEWLRVLGMEVPDTPDAVLIRWEQRVARRRWDSRPARSR